MLPQETQVLDMGAVPLDLSGNSRLQSSLDVAYMFVENTGTTEIRFRETTDMPALTDAGHILETRDSTIVAVSRNRPFWIWAPSGAGELAISDGAPLPAREV